VGATDESSGTGSDEVGAVVGIEVVVSMSFGFGTVTHVPGIPYLSSRRVLSQGTDELSWWK
jgi:hypothetical protein